MSKEFTPEYKIKTTPEAVNVANMILDSGVHDLSGRDLISRGLLAHAITSHSPSFSTPGWLEDRSKNTPIVPDSTFKLAHHPVMHEILKDRLIDAGTKLKSHKELDDYMGTIKHAFTNSNSPNIPLNTEQQHKIANTFHALLTHPEFNSSKWIADSPRDGYNEKKALVFSNFARDKFTDSGVRQKFYNTLDTFEQIHTDKDSKVLAATLRAKMASSHHATVNEMKTNYSKFADNPLKYNFHTGLSGRGKNFSRMYDDDMSDPNVWQKLLHDNKYFSETKGYMRANIHEGLRTMANSAHSNLEKIGSDGMVDLSSHVVNLLENHPTFKVIPNPEQPNLHSNRNSPEYLYSPEYLPGGVYTDTRIAHISRFEDLLHGALNSEKLLSNKQRGVNHLGTEEHAQLREKARQMIRMRNVSRNI